MRAGGTTTPAGPLIRWIGVLVCGGALAPCGGSTGTPDAAVNPDGGGGQAGSAGTPDAAVNPDGGGGQAGSAGTPDAAVHADGGAATDAGPPQPACGSEPFQPPTGGRTFFMAPTGNDAAAGTIDAPFRTMTQAARVARAGDIVYLRDGVYGHAEDFTATGAVGRPVVFMARPGEHPILDGTGLGLGQSVSVVQLFRPAHVVVAGLEVRNSTGRGVQIIDGEDVVIRDCTIHDTGFKAIGLNGNNLVAERNVIFNAVMSNSDPASGASGGWGSGVTTQVLEDGSPSSTIVVRGNIIHDVWGECIDALFVNGIAIIGNDVRDCYSVGIYVDTARSVRIEGNVIRALDPAHRRRDTGHLIDGILMGSEGTGDNPDFGAEDVVVANNLILGTHNGIGWWDDGDNTRTSNTYQRVQIVSNVVWGSEQNAIAFDKVPAGRTVPTGALLTDNVLFGGSLAGATSLQVADPAAWMIAANVFPGGVPATARDASNLGVDPRLTAPAVAAPAEAFRPSATSPCRHAGRPVANVPLDFACATRGTTDTTIGAFE